MYPAATRLPATELEGKGRTERERERERERDAISELISRHGGHKPLYYHIPCTMAM